MGVVQLYYYYFISVFSNALGKHGRKTKKTENNEQHFLWQGAASVSILTSRQMGLGKTDLYLF